MPFTKADGIETRYEIKGDGPPILMYAPGGFDARIEQWTDLGIYKRIKLLDKLPNSYTCILFDRRENGHSGGRIERITWRHYVRQGAGLLDALGIDKAHIMGGLHGMFSSRSLWCSTARAYSLDGTLLASRRG